MRDGVRLFLGGQRREGEPGAPFLHGHRDSPRVLRAEREERLDGVAHELPRGVVDVGLEDDVVPMRVAWRHSDPTLRSRAEDGPQEVGAIGEVLGSGAPADALRDEARPPDRSGGVRRDDGRAGGRDELCLDASVVGLEADEALDRSRSGEGEDSVARLYESAPHRQRGYADLGAEPVEQSGAPDDVDDRVDGAHLVKMDVLERRAMHLRLRERELVKRGARPGLYRRREGRLLEEPTDRAIRSLRLRLLDMNVEGGRDDAAPRASPEVHVEAMDVELRERLVEGCHRSAEVDERGHDHVPREPARSIEEEDLASARATGEVLARQLVAMLVRVRVPVPVLVLVRVRVRVRVRVLVLVLVLVLVRVLVLVLVRVGVVVRHGNLSTLDPLDLYRMRLWNLLPLSVLACLACVAGVACSSSGGSAPHDAAAPKVDAGAPRVDAKPSADSQADRSAPARDAGPATVTFPAHFLWGSATAGFQVEKGDDNTDWAAWVAMSGKIQNGDNPDVGGPDALDNITADVADLVATHQTAYRFSLEWARIYPTLADFMSDTPDPAAITAYSSLLDALVAAKITPVVTLDHYTLPQYVDDVTMSSSPQGWELPSTTTMFVTFASRMAARWGGQVDYWLTLNEPLVYAVAGYLEGSFPPGALLDVDRCIAVIKAEVLAHVQAYDAIHAADTIDADGDGKAALVSVAKHQRTFHPLDSTSAGDIAAAKHVEYLWNQWFFNVIVDGNWDDAFDGSYTEPNDKMNDPTLKGRADFLGINYYSDTLVSATSGIIIPAPVNASIEQAHLPTGRPETDVGWDIYAEGLGTVVDEAKSWGLPILITENGIADHADVNRPRFLYDHLYQLGWAMERGANVIGYLHWASVDNFEWASGFCPKYGLFSYDMTTEARTAKPSAMEYASIIKAGQVTLDDLTAAPAYATPASMCP